MAQYNGCFDQDYLQDAALIILKIKCKTLSGLHMSERNRSSAKQSVTTRSGKYYPYLNIMSHKAYSWGLWMWFCHESSSGQWWLSSWKIRKMMLMFQKCSERLRYIHPVTSGSNMYHSKVMLLEDFFETYCLSNVSLASLSSYFSFFNRGQTVHLQYILYSCVLPQMGYILHQL